MRTAAMLTALLLLGCTGSDAQPAGRRTIVLELFTSQGCSSCPPADALLSELRGEAGVIPLAYHVDYWNYIGWNDPFSSPRWSQRQRDYARALKSDQVYTPQLVVNGTAQLVGSARWAVRAEIDRQRQRPERGAVYIDGVERAGNALTVHVRARGGRGANLVVTLFENGIATAVKSGENAHRTLANDAVVRWQGIAGGPAVTIPLDPKWKQLGVAAFLQDPATLEIYAAAARELK